MSARKRVILLALLCTFPMWADCQQLPLFTQYREFGSIINPAAISHDFLFYEGYTTSFGLSYRDQWDKVEGGPVTMTLRGDHIFDLSNSVIPVAGGCIIKDIAGPVSLTGAYGRAAMLLSDDPVYRGLSVGLTAGMVQYLIETAELAAIYPDDILTFQDQKKIFPDIGFGVYAYKRMERGLLEDDIMYAGLSVPQLLGLDLQFQQDDKEFSIKRIPHFYALAGLNTFFSEKSFLETSLWIKTVKGAPLNADINLRYKMNATIWIGAGYSTAGIGHFEAGLELGENMGWSNVVRIGYGYDPSLASYGAGFGNVHEVNMSVILDRG